jgi:anti-sigma factor RsiW
MNENFTPAAPPENVDGALRSYFQAELPSPWPACPPAQARSGVRSFPAWVAVLGRGFLAASVALILIAYLALAGMFPAQPGRGLPVHYEETIGSKPGVKRPAPVAGKDQSSAERPSMLKLRWTD